MEEFQLSGITGPHAGIRVLSESGTQRPRKAAILLHGRGSNGANIMRARNHISMHNDVIYVAPTATDSSWYPKRFIVSQSENEPHLSSALAALAALTAHCDKKYGIDPKDIVFAGFSQGACLISEFVSKHYGRLGGVCIWSGGLIGTDEEVLKHTTAKKLDGTPIYIGCDENDIYIPIDRVKATAKILKSSGANVATEIYTGIGHLIHTEGYANLDTFLKQ